MRYTTIFDTIFDYKNMTYNQTYVKCFLLKRGTCSRKKRTYGTPKHEQLSFCFAATQYSSLSTLVCLLFEYIR